MSDTDINPIRVLLIEDNPVDARLVRADFDRRGTSEFRLTIADNMDEASSILKQGRIEVVLLDLFLQDTAGLETLDKVREMAPDVAVIVLTGLNDEEIAIQSLKQGAQDYLIKRSVDAVALFRAIRYAVERKQHEREHEIIERRLLEIQKLEAIGTLAGGVAHTFNNVLMVILGHSSLMLDHTAEGDSRRHLESINRAANRAANLTRQLLTFSKRHPIAPTVMSLNPVILEMQDLLESVMDHGKELHLELSAEANLVKVDPYQIQEMIMNLVLNSRNAMEDNGRVTIRIEQKPEVPGRVLLSVSDTGCGMQADTRAHMFDPFFSTKGLAEASGLGLSTVYGIANQHHATIEVSSTPGIGTTFTVGFPLFGTAESVRFEGGFLRKKGTILHGPKSGMDPEDFGDPQENIFVH